MDEFKFFQNMIKQEQLALHTAFLAKVIQADDKSAVVQPLMSLKSSKTGNQMEVGYVRAVVPGKIKFKCEKITYMVSDTESGTKTVMVPDNLAKDDIVYVGVCERDITNAVSGSPELSTMRNHDINDGVILCVL